MALPFGRSNRRRVHLRLRRERPGRLHHGDPSGKGQRAARAGGSQVHARPVLHDRVQRREAPQIYPTKPTFVCLSSAPFAAASDDRGMAAPTTRRCWAAGRTRPPSSSGRWGCSRIRSRCSAGGHSRCASM